jgi:hypothetical protein
MGEFRMILERWFLPLLVLRRGFERAFALDPGSYPFIPKAKKEMPLEHLLGK